MLVAVGLLIGVPLGALLALGTLEWRLKREARRSGGTTTQTSATQISGGPWHIETTYERRISTATTPKRVRWAPLPDDEKKKP